MTNALGKRLDRLERLALPAPPKAADLPVERWVEEATSFGPPPYSVEEDFFRWLEWLGGLLKSQMNLRAWPRRGDRFRTALTPLCRPRSPSASRRP